MPSRSYGVLSLVPWMTRCEVNIFDYVEVQQLSDQVTSDQRWSIRRSTSKREAFDLELDQRCRTMWV